MTHDIIIIIMYCLCSADEKLRTKFSRSGSAESSSSFVSLTLLGNDIFFFQILRVVSDSDI